jgi:biotin carboxyl carrier protein
VQHDYILRSTSEIEKALSLSLSGEGLLVIAEKNSAKIRLLRFESNGLLTVLWGERVVSGVLSYSGENRDALQITLEGRSYALQMKAAAIDAMEQSLGGGQRAQGILEIKSPIPGLVKAVSVALDQSVAAGQTIIVLEAMKMENEIASPHAGTIAALQVNPGQIVAAGELLAKVKT